MCLKTVSDFNEEQFKKFLCRQQSISLTILSILFAPTELSRSDYKHKAGLSLLPIFTMLETSSSMSVMAVFAICLKMVQLKAVVPFKATATFIAVTLHYPDLFVITVSVCCKMINT